MKKHLPHNVTNGWEGVETQTELALISAQSSRYVG